MVGSTFYAGVSRDYLIAANESRQKKSPDQFLLSKKAVSKIRSNPQYIKAMHLGLDKLIDCRMYLALKDRPDLKHNFPPQKVAEIKSAIRNFYKDLGEMGSVADLNKDYIMQYSVHYLRGAGRSKDFSLYRFSNKYASGGGKALFAVFDVKEELAWRTNISYIVFPLDNASHLTYLQYDFIKTMYPNKAQALQEVKKHPELSLTKLRIVDTP